MYEWIGQLTADEGRLRKARQILQHVPDFIIVFICSVAGMVMFVAFASLRRRILRNMRELLRSRLGSFGFGFGFPRVFARGAAYFGHLAITLYELLIVAPHLAEDGREAHRADVLSNSFHIKGRDHIELALQQNKGVIIFAAHTGNFFYYYWWLSQQYHCLAVATAASEPLLPIYLTFQKLGCHGLDYDRTPPIAMLNTLRKHLRNNGVIFLLGDFWRDVFPMSKLFNRSTRSPGGAAMLALNYSVPIIPLFSRRMFGLKHHMEFGESIQLSEQFEKDEYTEATNSLNVYLEQMILSTPDQWFYWFNVDDRWEMEAKQQQCPA